MLLGRPPLAAKNPEQAAVRQALDGIVRSVAKEVRAGATANLVLVDDGAEDALESTLRFFLSGRSAFVNGQVVAVAAQPSEHDRRHRLARPLAGRVAVVTGAARGIGAAIAGVLARDGARVVCADLPAPGERLPTVANQRRWDRPAARHHRDVGRRSASLRTPPPGTAGWTCSCTTPG